MTVADALSLVRIPLGGAFILIAHNQLVALIVVAVAGVTDVLDGWAARRALARQGVDRAKAPHHGDWLDPLCDKLFVGSMVLGLYLAYHPPLALLGLVLVREVLQVIAMIVYRTGRGLRRVERFHYRAGPIGKATTLAQFATALAILLGWHNPWPLAGAAAFLGLWSVAVYLSRVRLRPPQHATP